MKIGEEVGEEGSKEEGRKEGRKEGKGKERKGMEWKGKEREGKEGGRTIVIKSNNHHLAGGEKQILWSAPWVSTPPCAR